MPRPASTLSDCRGAAAVEFALLAPVLFALLLGIIEFGFQMWVHVTLDSALAQAARCYVLGYVDSTAGTNCGTVAGATLYLKSVATGIPFPTGALTVTSPAGGCLRYSYAASWLITGLMPMAAPTFGGTSCFYY